MSQPFAPATSYSLAATQPHHNLELKLTAKELHASEIHSEMFAIIKTLEIIEKSFIKDDISTEEYQCLCHKSITQYQTLLRNNPLLSEFQLDEFVKQYWILDCANAINRLHIGLPATIEHSIPNSAADFHEPVHSSSTGHTAVPPLFDSNTGNNNKLIAEITSNFITLMDALKLDFKTKDQLHPILSDLLTNLTAFFKNSPPDVVEGFKIHRQNLIDWLIKLNKMKLNEELNDEEIKTMLFDLESGYNGFYKSLR